MSDGRSGDLAEMDRRQGRRRSKAAWLALAVALAASTVGAAAPEDDLSIGQFRHTAWLSDSSFPSNIGRITQTRDGYLWMTGADGLSRFDGVKVETFSPADHDAMAPYSLGAILETRSGDLWVGFGGPGSVAIFRDGRFIDMGMPNPSRAAITMAQDHDGAIWVVNARTTKGLSRFVDGRWDEPAAAMGMPDGWIFSMMVARDGTLWLATMDKVVFLKRGASRFVVTGAV
ncbi:MAG: hypothetical protein K0R83_1601, partial [Caulobacter sp.]|nr:hypothetical protein [Caulobacter sp.]